MGLELVVRSSIGAIFVEAPFRMSAPTWSVADRWLRLAGDCTADDGAKSKRGWRKPKVAMTAVAGASVPIAMITSVVPMSAAIGVRPISAILHVNQVV